MDTAQQAELVRTLEYDDDAALAQALASLLAADARHQAATARQRARVLQGSLEAIEAPCAEIGDRVGPYVLRDILGRGGMGVVFRAERVDGHVRQEVALKIVRRPLLDEAGRERFHRERQIVAGFQHPCIARMLDAGQTKDGSPYLAMELIRGPTITGYCYALKLDTRRRIEVFLDVCDAVHHAHTNHVLHRDLKPGNVLIGQDGLPKLIDFGIAKPLATLSGGAQQRTTTDHRFFSPSNVAPEQLLGEQVGVACDVYQLGTLLHELLCGTVVFDAEGLTPGQLEERIVEIAPEAPSAHAARATTATAHAHGVATPAALARALRGELDAIVALALRKSPQERYASAEHLADDLRRYLDGRPVAAMRGQYWYRMRKFLRRRALTLGAWTVVIIVVTGLVTALWVQAQQIAHAHDPLPATQSQDAQSPPQPDSRNHRSP